VRGWPEPVYARYPPKTCGPASPWTTSYLDGRPATVRVACSLDTGRGRRNMQHNANTVALVRGVRAEPILKRQMARASVRLANELNANFQ
jgi:hypothetical protein